MPTSSGNYDSLTPHVKLAQIVSSYAEKTRVPKTGAGG